MLQISIITVHYKNIEILIKAFNKTKDKLINYPNIIWEFIVVDNSESNFYFNELLDWAKFHTEVRIVQSKSNYGFGEGCNMGVRNSNYDILWFLNSDAWITKFENFNDLNVLLKNHKTGLVSTVVIDKMNLVANPGATSLKFIELIAQTFRLGRTLRGKKLGIYILNRFKPNYINSSSQVRRIVAIGGASFLTRKDVWLEIGGFDDFFFLYDEEGDISLRCIKKGYNNYLFPHIEVETITSSTTSKLEKSKLLEIKYKSRKRLISKHFSLLEKYILLFITKIKKSSL